ncbi:hypothetical protein RYZ26_05030 [Terasakiella sp. A23]|uniref:hypothetical protein n=1 Tax=Terasakiella sp. FCG-A23 TaxID=3080561 RepID=UPI0029538159|nr:hypothetical protein [Terasakiella sp. A23]MDV7338943.1 hypothetical protein [Terasakiella sp. A23]
MADKETATLAQKNTDGATGRTVSKCPATTQMKKSISFEAHRRTVKYIFTVTLTISIITGLVLIYSQITEHDLVSTMSVAILAGVLGSMLSSLNRVYNFEYNDNSIDALNVLSADKTYLILYALVPPLVGAISAGLLYLMFAAGLIQGDIFPIFSCELGPGKCDEFQTFLSSWNPKDANDYAKMIFWGAVAGFSERMVPNLIGKMASKVEDTTSPDPNVDDKDKAKQPA